LQAAARGRVALAAREPGAQGSFGRRRADIAPDRRNRQHDVCADAGPNACALAPRRRFIAA
jgi:hypothetical protein